MKIKEIIKTYLKALEEADITAILDLFSNKGKVHSPLYGLMPADQFYKKLFSDTQQSLITLFHIFQETDRPDRAAVHFRYEWKMKDGSTTGFECVDVFYLDEQEKIEGLHIIYDTWHTRPRFESLAKHSDE